jgi:hypothetical protein
MLRLFFAKRLGEIMIFSGRSNTVHARRVITAGKNVNRRL